MKKCSFHGRTFNEAASYVQFTPLSQRARAARQIIGARDGAIATKYTVSGVLCFAGLVTAAITRNERYHQFYAVFFLVQTVVISFVIFHTLV